MLEKGERERWERDLTYSEYSLCEQSRLAFSVHYCRKWNTSIPLMTVPSGQTEFPQVALRPSLLPHPSLLHRTMESVIQLVGLGEEPQAQSSLFLPFLNGLFLFAKNPVSTIPSLSQKITYLYIEGRLLAAMFMPYDFTPWPSPPWIRPGNPDHTGSIGVSLDFGIMIQRQLILSAWN